MILSSPSESSARHHFFVQPKCIFDEESSNIQQIENHLNDEMDLKHQFDLGRLMHDTSKITKRNFYYQCLVKQFNQKKSTKTAKRKFARKDSLGLIRETKYILMSKKRKDLKLSSNRRYSYLNNMQRSQQMCLIKIQKKQQEIFIKELKQKV